MKKTTVKLEWIFDYYVAYFLFNPNKIERYFQYLNDKWDFETEKSGIPILKEPQDFHNLR
ncbi:MAG: hypothetical protein WCJ95_13220 [Mariniphaga sp.]